MHNFTQKYFKKEAKTNNHKTNLENKRKCFFYSFKVNNNYIALIFHPLGGETIS